MKDSKNVFIMGDSYSTYEGYIPEGYNCYYSDSRTDAPVIRGADRTWWKILESESGLTIVQNDSYSGSTISNTVRENFPVSSSFVSRIDQYLAEDFFRANEIDTMLLFGGTNDSWINAPVGNLQYADWTAEDLKCVLPAFCYLLDRAKRAVENVLVIINSDLKPQITEGFAEASEKNGIPYVRLSDIDKENGHPTELGMKQIAAQAAEHIR